MQQGEICLSALAPLIQELKRKPSSALLRHMKALESHRLPQHTQRHASQAFVSLQKPLA